MKRWAAFTLAFALFACDDDDNGNGDDPEVGPDMAANGMDADVAPPDEGPPPDGPLPDVTGADGPVDDVPDAGDPPDEGDPDILEADAGDGGEVPDVVLEDCGDGVLDEGEQCDDGNLDAGDGCDEACRLEVQQHEEPDSREMPLELEFGDDGVAAARFVLDGIDEDWFAFTLEDATDVVVETHSPDDRLACDGDTELTLFADAGDELGRNDNREFSLCSVLQPVDDEAVRDLAPGRYLVRVAPLSDGRLSNVLVVRRVERVGEGDPCHARGLDGRCDEGLRCGRVPVDGFVGACTAPGCTDGAPDEGEACDDGNDADDDICSNACALNGPAESEPNEDADAASEMGDSLAPSLGTFQINSAFADADDVDTFSLTLPDGPPTELGFFTRDGFLGCPGVVRARLWAAGAPDAPLAQTELACDVTFVGPLAPGEYVVQLTTADAEVVDVPLTTFVAPTSIVGAGSPCGTPGVRCEDGAYCDDAVEEPACVAHGCGDGRMGPGEECDDGNIEAGDGCSAACLLEAARVDGGGQFPGALAAGEADLYAFTVDELTFVELETSDGQQLCPGDTEVRLFRRTPDGFEITARNDDGPVNAPCSRLGAYVEPGDWRVEVTHHFGEALEAYVLGVLFRPVSGDGGPCGGDAVCARELVCSGMPATCAPPRCGDGVQGPGERCDDGNEDDGDGCSAACESEAVDVNAGGDFAGRTGEGEIDFYVFDLISQRTVRAEVSDGEGGCPADTFLNLERRDDGGVWVRVVTDDDGGIDACSLIEIELEPGRYRLQVHGLGGLAIGDYVLSLDLLGVAGEGGACDRAGRDVVCAPGLFCLQTNVEGQGLCGELLPTVDEAEPNEAVEGAMPIAPDMAVTAHLEPEGSGPDFYDLYAVTLNVPTTISVETGDGRGGCPGDTVLYRIDPDTLTDEGLQAALDDAAARNDDVADGVRCSRLDEALDAGTHYYLVEDFRRNDPLDYTAWFRALFPLRVDDTCDPDGIQNRCGAGLSCDDDDGDGDGRCAE